jgi:hypothetical protein
MTTTELYSVEYSAPVDLSAVEAWTKLSDLSKAHLYVPGLTGLDMTTEERTGVGASRRVYQGTRLTLDETVVDWNEGEGFSLRLHRGDKGPLPPMTEAWFDYGLQQQDEQVVLINRMRYRLGLGWLGKVLQSLFIERIAANAVRDTTLAQKIYYETGAAVSPAQLAAARDGE